MHQLQHVAHLGEEHPRELGRHRVVQRFYHLVLQNEAQSHALDERVCLRTPGGLRHRDRCGAQTSVAQCARWHKDFHYVRHEVDHRVARSYGRQTIFHHVVHMIFHRAEQKACRHEERKIFRRDLQTACHHAEQKACHREARRACHHGGQSCARHDLQMVCLRVVRRDAIRDQHNHHLEPSCDRY